MSQRSIVLCLAFLLAAPFALAGLPAASEPPPDMSYQGQFLDAQGVPKPDTVNIQIRIYEMMAPMAGESPLFAEDHENVALVNTKWAWKRFALRRSASERSEESRIAFKSFAASVTRSTHTNLPGVTSPVGVSVTGGIGRGLLEAQAVARATPSTASAIRAQRSMRAPGPFLVIALMRLTPCLGEASMLAQVLPGGFRRRLIITGRERRAPASFSYARDDISLHHPEWFEAAAWPIAAAPSP